MTSLLEKAFAEAAKLPAAEQDLLAERLLSELTPEESFDHRLETTSGKLAGLAQEALRDLREGRTEPLDLNRL